MILEGKEVVELIRSLKPLSEGIKFLSMIFLFVFLVDTILVFMGKEKGRKLPVKTYVAYLSVYSLYKLSVLVG